MSKPHQISSEPDHIKIYGLSLTAALCESPWTTADPEKPVLQPVVFSLDIHHDIKASGQDDDLTKSVDYSAVCKTVQKACQETSVGKSSCTALDLVERTLISCISSIALPILQVDIELELPKAVLRAKSACVKESRFRDGTLSGNPGFLVKDLLVHTIIGIHPHERIDKQPVVVNLAFIYAEDMKHVFKFNFAKLEHHISEFVDSSAFLTVEALATGVAQQCFGWLEAPQLYTITVSIAKPAALRMADAPEITITRTVSDFPAVMQVDNSYAHEKPTKVLAALAIGANVGDRFQNIELALRHLDNFRDSLSHLNLPSGEIIVVDTSFLYESAPMYVESQPAFINCACLVETTLQAHDLLRVCKLIESAIGRVPSVRFGPRAVDLDIITYNYDVIDTRDASAKKVLDDLESQLVVPHPRMAEREFVLRPLKDIIPEWVHPCLRLSVRSLLAKVMLAKSPADPPMHKVVPYPCSTSIRPPSTLNTPSTLTYWSLPNPQPSVPNDDGRASQPFVMATLNVTPDSFSDGSEHFNLDDALSYARDSALAGADIIDIGGYSTRPGAAFVSTEDEISRVVPVIEAIREDKGLEKLLISVDTFRCEVARAAILAGANCINDVCAFSGPAYPPNSESIEHFNRMRDLSRELSVPVIMMHSRGDAGSNKDYSAYSSPSDTNESKPVLEGVRAELGRKVDRAVRGKGGLRRWQIIVDPGIGFSKTVQGNLEVLRNASALTAEFALPSSPYNSDSDTALRPYASPRWNLLAGYPLLIGTSRKSFLGEIIASPRPFAHIVAPDTSQAPADRPAKTRDFATASAVACAVQQGAAVLRVHEIRGMLDVVKVAAALWF